MISTLVLAAALAAPLTGAKPNIVLVMTDDQGYGDLACHGHPFLQTPHLDALHAQSTRLTDFHVSPTCAPTRSALLSGRLPFRNGVTHTILERERLALDATTLAQVLKGAGYATGIFGKWHLGDEDAYQPGARGFDEVFIHGGGGIGQVYPGSCADAPPNAGNNKRDGYMGPVVRHNGTFVKTSDYCTDAFFNQATRWIDAQGDAGKPFFAYISTNAPHGPYICPQVWQQPYVDTAPSDRAAAFCGMVTNIDDNVGRLRAHLEAQGLADNTLFIFMTDNGSAGGIYNASLKGAKGSLHEGGTRVPAFWHWPGHLEAGRDIDTLTRHVDVLPTLAAIVGADTPEDVDGRNLIPLLEDAAGPWLDRMTFFHGGRWGKRGMDGRWGGSGPASMRLKTFAVRNERWRLVGTAELYDIVADPGETTNVIDLHPEIAADLQQAYGQWWENMQPYLVNEDVPLSPTHPYHEAFAAQEASMGIPAQRIDERPNIILLFTDDQRDGTFGAMGHAFHTTPHVDALLAKSVRFTNAYTATPVCSPSRVSMLTGQSERTHGVGFGTAYQLNDAQWAQTYPSLLRAAGYFTGFIGKFGVEYYTFKGKASERFDWWWGHDGWTKFHPKDFGTASCTPYHRAEHDEITFIMGEAMADFLDEAPADKPFCLSVSFNVPHGSQVTSMFPGYDGWHSMTRPANDNPKLKGSPFYDTLYRDAAVEIPAATATDPYVHIPKSMQDQDKGRRTQTYTYNYTRPTNLEHHVRYGQAITALDAVIGDLLVDLDRRGLRHNTVIIFASDHGLLMGEYGMGGKALLYDLAAKIPCFVYDPQVSEARGGTQVDALVTSTDITATMLDYAGVEAPAFMEGASLRGLIEGATVDWRDELFLESLFVLRDTPFQEGIRRGRWKYIRMFDGVNGWREADIDFAGRTPQFEMLFDLEADPGEAHNLIGQVEVEAVLAELRDRCAEQSRVGNARRAAFQAAVVTTAR